jgi:hypothetical protein
MRVSATPYLRPGETVQAVLGAQTASQLLAAVSGVFLFDPAGPGIRPVARTEYSTPAITLAGGNPVIAIQTSHDGLPFYRRQSGTDTWRGEPVAGNQSTYSAPSIAQDGSSVIAFGASGNLLFYGPDSNGVWRQQVVSRVT